MFNPCYEHCYLRFGKYTMWDLTKVRNLGKRCIEEIVDKYKQYGADIVDNIED